MTIKKVKWNEGEVKIEYEMPAKEKDKVNKYTLACKEEPAPSFCEVFNQLREHAIEVCELENVPKEKVIVISVTFSYATTENIMGATINFHKYLQYSSQPLNINTPMKWEAVPNKDGIGDPKSVMTKEMNKLLYLLQDEAEYYINGNRAQVDMFEEEK